MSNTLAVVMVCGGLETNETHIKYRVYLKPCYMFLPDSCLHCSSINILWLSDLAVTILLLLQVVYINIRISVTVPDSCSFSVEDQIKKNKK